MLYIKKSTKKNNVGWLSICICNGWTNEKKNVTNYYDSLINVIQIKRNPTDFSHPDRSIRKALVGLFPFIFMVGGCYTWLRLWPEVVHEHLNLFIPLVGLLFGHQVGLMIISHVAKLDFPYWNSSVNLILAAGCCLAYLDKSLET